jgi:hypothetical protein
MKTLQKLKEELTSEGFTFEEKPEDRIYKNGQKLIPSNISIEDQYSKFKESGKHKIYYLECKHPVENGGIPDIHIEMKAYEVEV